MQTQQCGHTVHVLAAVFLRLDHHHPRLCDAVIAQIEKPFFQIQGQAGSPNVKAQLNGAGHLVHILATGPLRPNGCELKLIG